MDFLPKSVAPEGVVSSKARKRISRVLAHLQKQKECKTTCTLHMDPCSSSSGGDIEDLLKDGKRRVATAPGTGKEIDESWLFNSKRFENVQRPLLEASTLPRECYNSRQWYERELTNVFRPSWVLVGREDEVAEPGMFLSLDLEFAGPIAICRGNDMQLHAFANSCRHRGAKILQNKSGKAPSIGMVCPYHAWTYDFDGKLKWAPRMHNAKDFDEDDIRLAMLKVETFCGFIFVCAAAPGDPRYKPLKEALGNISQVLEPWFDPIKGAANNMVCVKRRTYTVECNWKFLMENTCETYHTSVVHKNSLGPMAATPVEPHDGDWDAVVVPSERSIVPLPDDFSGKQFPLPAFTDKTAFANVFPSTQINATWDCLWVMRLLPLGPSTTEIEMMFCFPRDTVKEPDFNGVLQHYLKRWHIAVTEDNTISLNQKKGVMSPFRVPGRFSHLEFGTHNFNNWLVSRTVDGDARNGWNPGRRVFIGQVVKVDDAEQQKMNKVIDEAEKSGLLTFREGL